MAAWLLGLHERRGKANAIIALVNELGRIVWRVLTSYCEYDVNRAFKSM